MKLHPILPISLIVASIHAFGCDRTPPKSEAPAPLPAPVLGQCSIRGSVKFTGSIPPAREIPNEPCHKGAGPLLDETVVVNDNGTLKNVFVYISNAAPSSGASHPPALLDQVNCQYVPHVVGVQVQQQLRVRSSDPTIHNVHYVPSKNPSKNLSMTQAGEETTVSFSSPEFIRVKCDVHPWMTAHIGVFDTPFFATTGDDGTFTINGLPAGAYVVKSWHETYGVLEQTVNASEGPPANVEFEYKAR